MFQYLYYKKLCILNIFAAMSNDVVLFKKGSVISKTIPHNEIIINMIISHFIVVISFSAIVYFLANIYILC